MPEIVLLGTAWALPSVEQENTYMALKGEHHTVLIDCAGSPYRRILKAGINPDQLDTLILTHAHPDHIYGVPSLVMSLWLAGRTAPLAVYATDETCETVESMMALYHPEHWPGMFSVHYHPVPFETGALLLDSPDFRVTIAQMRHMLPTIGLRILSHASGKVLAYSADTEPTAGVNALAEGADILVHEASGAGLGHSSAAQAGKAAHAGGVARLVLVHYGSEQLSAEELLAQARSAFDGAVWVARDLDRFTW